MISGGRHELLETPADFTIARFSGIATVTGGSP